jgi:hypothetical protein
MGGTGFAPQALPRRAAASCGCTQMTTITRVMRSGSRYRHLFMPAIAETDIRDT